MGLCLLLRCRRLWSHEMKHVGPGSHVSIIPLLQILNECWVQSTDAVDGPCHIAPKRRSSVPLNGGKGWTRTCDLSDYCTSRVGIPKEIEATFHRGVKAVRGGNTMQRHRQAVHGVGTKVAGGYWVAVVAVPTKSKRLFDLKPFLFGRAPVPVPATPEHVFRTTVGQENTVERLTSPEIPLALRRATVSGLRPHQRHPVP